MKLNTILLACLFVASSAQANYLDDLRISTKLKAEQTEKSDAAMLEKGEISIDYAQRYVREVGHVYGPYWMDIYAYVYAGRVNEIKWTPNLLNVYKTQVLICQNATASAAKVERENDLTIDGFSGDMWQKTQVINQLGRKSAMYRELASNSCRGTEEAKQSASAYEKSNPSARSDLFSK